MTQFLLEGFAENVPKAGKKCWKALQEKKEVWRGSWITPDSPLPDNR